MRLKIAFRNIVRNRSRSALSIMMIAAAVAGIIAFRGFSDHIMTLLKNTTIDNQYNHIEVARNSYWDMSPGPRKNQLIDNSAQLVNSIKALPGVQMVAGRLSFYGLLSTGETTISAEGVGYDPTKEIHFQKSLVIEEGRSLSGASKTEVIVGSGLRKRLSLKVGQIVTALSYTLDGVVNAVDLTIVGIFRVGTEDVDSHVFMLPISGVQTLLDTDAVELLTIRVNQTEITDQVLPLVERAVKAISPDIHSRSWYEISDHYRQIEQFYSVQNRVVEVILVSLILLSIMNSVGMSVFERTGEIGTIRALGETRAAVVFQFTLEGALLGIFGVLGGYVLGTVLSLFLASLHLTMVLPNASFPVPILINLVPRAFVVAGIIGLVTAIASTLIPSIRASRIGVVDALKKNI
jgi:putative ABC transport system permease protein